MRRKCQYHMNKFCETMEEAFAYVRQIKEINKDQIQVEIRETSVGFGEYWYVEVWKVK